jgi:hypothetical protein
MNGEMANLITLTTYGNQYLTGPKDAKPPELLMKNSTFIFTRSIDFYEVKGTRRRPREYRVAKSTGDWFRYLRRMGVKNLRLAAIGYNDSRPYMPDRVAVAFAGCSNWSIVTQTKKGTKVWILQDETVEDFSYKSKVKRIWETTVRAYSSKVPLRDTPASYDAAEKALKDALVEIARYAKKRSSLRYWVPTFKKALAVLNKKRTPSYLYWDDLTPKKWLSPRARRLTSAAQVSWVFGGMCSWNDTNFGLKGSPGYKEYTRVSNLLYRAMIDALVYATNEGNIK